MDKARLLQFRSEVIAAFEKAKGHRVDAPAIAAKKVRLSTIGDGTAEAEVGLSPPGPISEMFREHAQRYGDYPSEEIEPTRKQLSTVGQLVRSGSLPYVDFSLFGP
eukprot:1010019-Alexandrium_andersonii.AAC.1